MKACRLLIGLLLTGWLVAQEVPRITALERSQGWRFLFDGLSLDDWRGYRQNRVPANWEIAEGSLVGQEGTALVSTAEFEDFELLFDWKVVAGGSAAVFYRVDEDVVEPGESGLVMQLAGDGVVMAGNGGLSQPWREITFQPDVWYRARITVFGNRVEHLINSDRLLSYVIDSPDWQAAVAESRYQAHKDYGRLRAGPIMLSGQGVAFRNIKIRSQ